MKLWYGFVALVFILGLALSGCVTIMTSDRCRDAATGRFVSFQ